MIRSAICLGRVVFLVGCASCSTACLAEHDCEENASCDSSTEPTDSSDDQAAGDDDSTSDDDAMADSEDPSAGDDGPDINITVIPGNDGDAARDAGTDEASPPDGCAVAVFGVAVFGDACFGP